MFVVLSKQRFASLFLSVPHLDRNLIVECGTAANEAVSSSMNPQRAVVASFINLDHMAYFARWLGS